MELEQENLTLVLNNRSLMSLNYSFPVLLYNCYSSLSLNDDDAGGMVVVDRFGPVANIDEWDSTKD